MKKDFDTWNTKKKDIQEDEPNRRYHERDIWFCSLGVNVGFEQDGTGSNFDRPIVVVKGFNANTFFAVALTGRKREGKYYQYLGETGKHRQCSLKYALLILSDLFAK